MTKSKSTGAKVFPPKVTDQRSSVGKRNKISTGVEASMRIEPKERKNGNLQTIAVFEPLSSRSFLIGFRAISLCTFVLRLGIREDNIFPKANFTAKADCVVAFSSLSYR
jgi:hypothetical protein